MTVHLTDYTPNKIDPRSCNHHELNETVKAIRRDGWLRLHARDRLLTELADYADEMGYEPVMDKDNEWPEGFRVKTNAEVS